MSKSLGNVIDPRIVMMGGKDAKKDPPYGADVLRLWVASVDYSSDVLIGGKILGQVCGAGSSTGQRSGGFGCFVSNLCPARCCGQGITQGCAGRLGSALPHNTQRRPGRC
jgi:hypothetical protein